MSIKSRIYFLKCCYLISKDSDIYFLYGHVTVQFSAFQNGMTLENLPLNEAMRVNYICFLIFPQNYKNVFLAIWAP